MHLFTTVWCQLHKIWNSSLIHKVPDVARGEILLWLWCASGGSIRGTAEGNVWMDKQKAWSTACRSDDSLNKTKGIVPQSNVTWPNNNKVGTGSVFGNLYKEINTAVICEGVSVRPTLCHISAWKTAAKNSFHYSGAEVTVLKKKTTFSQKTASLLTSDTVRQRPVYWWPLCSHEI